MKTMQETYKGIGFCLLIAIPAFLLGKQFEVIGGPVFAILIGMCLALLVKESGSLQAGIKFTSKKILQYAVNRSSNTKTDQPPCLRYSWSVTL